MTDDRHPVDTRPPPRYGQYAPLPGPGPAPTVAGSPVAPVPPESAPPVTAPPPVVAARRRRDVVITTVLMLLGVFDVATSAPVFAGLGPSLTQVYAQLGVEGAASASLAAPYGLAINLVRGVLLVVTIVVALLLIARHRRAFWVPLAGYVIASLVTSALLVAVILNDPAYLGWLAQHR